MDAEQRRSACCRGLELSDGKFWGDVFKETVAAVGCNGILIVATITGASHNAVAAAAAAAAAAPPPPPPPPLPAPPRSTNGPPKNETSFVFVSISSCQAPNNLVSTLNQYSAFTTRLSTPSSFLQKI
jgi:hypothetical protein